MGTPALVEIIEQHPHRIFPLQVVRDESSQLLDVVSVNEFRDLICGEAPTALLSVFLFVSRAKPLRQGGKSFREVAFTREIVNVIGLTQLDVCLVNIVSVPVSFLVFL